MARLAGRLLRSDIWFEISPIPGEQGRDSTAFEVRFSTETTSEPVVKRFSIEGWQDECEPFWLFARAFSEAEAIVGAKMTIDRWNTGKESHESAALHDYMGCLHLILFGNAKLRSVSVRLFVEEDEEKDLFTSVMLNAPVETAQQFGRRLEQEIIEACPTWWAERCALYDEDASAETGEHS